MVLKAKSRFQRKTNLSSQEEVRDEFEEMSFGGDDGLVMVVFPRETWDKVQELSKYFGVEPAGVLSVALEMLDDKVKGEEA